MKRLLIINEYCGHGSTGKICGEIAEKYEKDGWKVKIAFGRDNYVPDCFKKYAVRITNDLDVKTAALECRVLDNAGLANRSNTKKFLKWADDFNPDKVWLHNLHGYYINYEMLFDWIKSKPNLEVKWTLHDCWAFTGHCAYFTAIDCKKWKTHCEKCPQKYSYPKSSVKDNSYNNYKRKKSSFTGVKDLTIITPSQWLANLVKESFLREYPTKVIHNTIDTSIFKPTPSDFRKKYGLEDKIIILGVASVWEPRKGLNDFYKLATMLDDRYTIVLVGLSNKQIKGLPKNIIGLKCTNSQKDLAAIYTAADVLFNPTYEDNYPTVNLEAQACGTTVVTYDTGGSSETVPIKNVLDVGNLHEAINKFELLHKNSSIKKA